MVKKNDPPDELVILHRNGPTIYIDTTDRLTNETARDAFFEKHFDRILYGGDLKYAPARHIVKGVGIYGDANLSRTRLRIKNLGEIKEKRPGCGGY